jgi:periplasmic copper chaperone A
MPRHIRSVVLAATVVLVAACGVDDDAAPVATDAAPVTTDLVDSTEPELPELPAAHDAWVRMPAMGQTVAGGYVTFVNGGDVDVQLTDVSSPLAEAELHETVSDDDGIMRMQHRPEGFVVPANGEFAMAPGAAHVMLLGIDPLDMATLDEVELVFEFGDVGSLTVMAEIRRDTSMPGHGHGDGDGDGDGSHGSPESHGSHGDHGDHGDHGVREVAHDGLDPHALHQLDDELHMGVYEPERQMALVAASIAAVDELVALDDAPDGVDVDRLRSALVELGAALESGDLDAAKPLAFEVHDLTHALLPGDHHHDH